MANQASTSTKTSAASVNSKVVGNVFIGFVGLIHGNRQWIQSFTTRFDLNCSQSDVEQRAQAQADTDSSLRREVEVSMA